MLILPLCSLSLTTVAHYELFTCTFTAEKRPADAVINSIRSTHVYKTFCRKALSPATFLAFIGRILCFMSLPYQFQNILMNEMISNQTLLHQNCSGFSWSRSSINFPSISPSHTHTLGPDNDSFGAPPTVTNMMDLMSSVAFPSPMMQQDSHIVSH